MATEYTTSFSTATEGGYKTRESAKSSALSSATNSLSSLTIDADVDVIENKTIIAGAVVVDSFDTAASGTITISSAADIKAQIKATATDALKITGGTVYHNDAFTVLVPEDAGGYAGDITATVMARNSMGSTPSGNQIHWYLDPSGDAAKIANLKLAINGTTDTTKVKFGSSFTDTLGVKGLTASDGVASTESYASLTADNAGTDGNDIALTDTVGTVLVNESALTGGKLAGGTAGGTHTIALTATDTTAITATADISATTSSDSVSPTFAIDTGSNDNTAANLTTCLNANSRLTATRVDNVVTVNQVIGGTAGNTAITITDPDSVGMTKTDFTGGGGPDLVLQASHNNTDWVTSTILSSEIAGTVDIYKFLPDLSRVYAPYFRLLLNSGGVNIGTSGTAKFFFAYQ